MNEYNKNKYQYRFSGYPPPLIQLDGTGPAYWLKFYTHPYYINQPRCWRQPIYRWGGVKVYGNTQSNNSEETNGNQLYVQLPVCQK